MQKNLNKQFSFSILITGASKEIGTALTRVCLRHKAVETRLKTFTAAIMDCLVQPLQVSRFFYYLDIYFLLLVIHRIMLLFINILLLFFLFISRIN